MISAKGHYGKVCWLKNLAEMYFEIGLQILDFRKLYFHYTG